MTYQIRAHAKIEDDLSAIPVQKQIKIRDAISALSDTPRPVGALKLSGYSDAYRIRIGRYRVVYRIEDRQLFIMTIAVAERGKVYPLAKCRLK